MECAISALQFCLLHDGSQTAARRRFCKCGSKIVLADCKTLANLYASGQVNLTSI